MKPMIAGENEDRGQQLLVQVKVSRQSFDYHPMTSVQPFRPSSQTAFVFLRAQYPRHPPGLPQSPLKEPHSWFTWIVFVYTISPMISPGPWRKPRERILQRNLYFGATKHPRSQHLSRAMSHDNSDSFVIRAKGFRIHLNSKANRLLRSYIRIM